MEPVTCKKCGSVDDYRTSNSGQHVRADCNQCGAYIKFLPQNMAPVCYIGKYSGTLISEITDASWLTWILANVPIKPGMKQHFQTRLNQLSA